MREQQRPAGRRSSRPPGGGRPDGGRRGDDVRYGERGGQGAVAGPPVDEDAVISALDPSVRRELSSLPGTLAEKVAGHLIMAGRLMEDDPELARTHALTAHDLAPRIVAVREALAIAAYRDGDYRTAIREARTVRRMSGDDTWLPMIADCERGLGKPDRALDLLAETDLTRLPHDVWAECLMVQSGARTDLGQLEAAVAVLEVDQLLRTRSRNEWASRLRTAYAQALRNVGRDAEADRWERSALATDAGPGPDADTRARELQELEILDVAVEDAEARDTD